MAGTSPTLVVGLGNPGAHYRDTPHNIGFDVVDYLSRRLGIRLGGEGFVKSGMGDVQSHPVILVQPQTFMNNSGLGIASIMKSRRLTHRDLVVVHDELDLPWTGLRIKRSGSAAGHNGVKSIIAALKTDSFVRVRVGVRPEHPIEDAAE
jgi:PTH1 family peptidyl-tRNA hydrolase